MRRIDITSRMPPQRFCVRTDYDVTTMRQEVRRIARTLGLGLAKQAKITTAISSLARVLLARYRSAMFELETTAQGTPAALEIACMLESVPARGVELEQILHLADVQLLVDETTLSYDTGEAILRLRMHLAPPTRG
jgi:hypothetical protein